MAEKSKLKGFSKGLVTDSDPRMQLDGTYRDAMNIKVINTDGSTFTIENINGNKKVIDLTDTDIVSKADYLYNGDPVTSPFSYDYFVGATDANGDPIKPYGIGDGDGTTPENKSLKDAVNIVGHFSFKNQLVLIVCGLIGTSPSIDDFKTLFFLLDFDNDNNVIKTTELRVCYDFLGNQFPNLNMDPLIKCRVEGITENDCISRIYWTDNKNPLRTLNIRGKRLETLNPDELDITPKCDHSQIVLSNVISGSLPVGVYQYCYKYLTDAGAETGISPTSNLYHISDADSTSYSTYQGGAPGSISADGFELSIKDLDTDFDEVQIYALFYNNLNVPPQVTEVVKKSIPNSGVVNFKHTTLLDVIADGLEKILIPSNTWDICKDIAIKDNVLFAANLRQKRNYISEKEWNVKVRRFNQDSKDNPTVTGHGSLTTNDPEVKEYHAPFAQLSNEILDETTVTEVSGGSNYVPLDGKGFNYDTAHRYLRGTHNCLYSNDVFSNMGGNGERRVLGAESYGYYSNDGGTNGLGGCMVSFRQVPKISDTIDNRGGKDDGNSAFISTNIKNDSFQTDNIWKAGGTPDYESSEDNTSTEFTATLNIGSNKDPMAAGSKRGYQRGETYRFGVLVYDLNGDPGNVLWIGDIQMPEHHDKAWELDLNFGPDNDGTITGIGRNYGSNATKFKENSDCQDYRISANGSGPVPAAGLKYDDTACINGTDINSHGNAKEFGFLPENREGQHLTFDLALDFSFKIPLHVLKRISGFQVVRAERTETDRTIVQSGLLNQTINYGPKTGGSGGYYGTVNANDTENIIDDNVDQIYDQVLNGYVGLAELSTRCVGFTDDKEPLYLNEGDSSVDDSFHAGSGYFGSFSMGRRNGGGSGSPASPAVNVNTIGNIHLMYSPDSTFGIRPYLSRAEDKLKIVSVMKLYDQRRYDHHAEMNDGNSITDISIGHANTTVNPFTNYASKNQHDTLFFSSKKTTLTDKKAGVLVGKLYVFDPYFALYTDHGHFNGDQHYTKYNGHAQYVHNPGPIDSAKGTIDGVTANYTSPVNPNGSTTISLATGWSGNIHSYVPWYERQIVRGKEIVDGEIVASGFFKKTYNSTNSQYVWSRPGFSNFTLGHAKIDTGAWRSYMEYGKIDADLEAADVNYDTISTLQMGTRAILLQTDFKGSWDYLPMKDLSYCTMNQDWKASKASRPTVNAHGEDCMHGEVHLPYYYYGNIYRTNNNQYGGNSVDALENTRWIAAGNKHQLRQGHGRNDIHHLSTVFGGDTFVGIYSHQMTTSPYPDKSYSKWIVFPCESFVNTEMRSGLNLGNNDHVEGFDQTAPPFSNDWFYNPVYSQENNTKSYLSVKKRDCEFTDLPYEVAYSKTKLAGEESDAFRVFPIFNFYDVEAIHGSINRLINFNNEIYFVQENAFGQLLVNPRTFLSDATGGQTLFTGSGDTIESHQYISVKYGTQHMHSVIASESGLYFFDSRYAKLLKFDTAKQFTVLSDEIGCRDLFKKAIEYGRLNIKDKYHKAPRVNLADMPLYFIGIHGGFDYQNNTLYLTFNDRLRIDQYDRTKYPEGTYVLNRRNVNQSTGNTIYQVVGRNPLDRLSVGSLSAQYPDGIGVGGFAEKFFISTTIAFSEDLNAVVSKYSVYPQQWIEHQGNLLTPKSRVPWLYYGSVGNLSTGFHHVNYVSGSSYTGSAIMGAQLSGSYGTSNNFYWNPAKYAYGAHELTEGGMQLWQWDHKLANKTTYFSDTQLHAKNSAIAFDLNYENTSGFVSLMKVSAVNASGVITAIHILDPGSNYPDGTYDIKDQTGNVVATIDAQDGFMYESNITITSTDSYAIDDELTVDAPMSTRTPVIHASYVEKVINEGPGENKKFDNLNVVMSTGDINNVYYGTSVNQTDRNKAVNSNNIASTDIGRYVEKIEFVTDFSDIGRQNIQTDNNPFYQTETEFQDTLHKYREGVLRAPIRNLFAGSKNPRLTGTYLRVKLTARTQEKFNIFAIMAKYRKSFN